MPHIHFPLKSVAIATCLALGLSACGGGSNMVGSRGLESVNQPVVERSNYTIDLAMAGGTLPIAEQRKLSGWFQAMDLGYGDHIAIDDASGSSAARSIVEAAASRHGLLVSRNAPVTQGYVTPGMIRVVITRSRASVPNCPNWSRNSDFNFRNAASPNYGCAINGNIAAMVADPEDLVRGQAGDPSSDAESAGKAIKTYRDATPTGAAPLKSTGTQSGGGQ